MVTEPDQDPPSAEDEPEESDHSEESEEAGEAQEPDEVEEPAEPEEPSGEESEDEDSEEQEEGEGDSEDDGSVQEEDEPEEGEESEEQEEEQEEETDESEDQEATEGEEEGDDEEEDEEEEQEDEDEEDEGEDDGDAALVATSDDDDDGSNTLVIGDADAHTLRFRLFDPFTAGMTDVPYRIEVGDQTFEDTTSDGWVEVEVEDVPERATVEWGAAEEPGTYRYSREVYLVFEDLDDDEARKRRLHNLGYDEDADSDVNLGAFREHYGVDSSEDSLLVAWFDDPDQIQSRGEPLQGGDEPEPPPQAEPQDGPPPKDARVTVSIRRRVMERGTWQVVDADGAEIQEGVTCTPRFLAVTAQARGDGRVLRVLWKDASDESHEVATLDLDALAAGGPLEVDLPEPAEDEDIETGTGEGESWPQPPPPEPTLQPVS